MKFVILFFVFNVATADESKIILTDAKFLCAIQKLDKTFKKDKNFDVADITERLYAMRESSVRSQTAKDFLKAVSVMSPAKQEAAWNEFYAKQKVKCL